MAFCPSRLLRLAAVNNTDQQPLQTVCLVRFQNMSGMYSEVATRALHSIARQLTHCSVSSPLPCPLLPATTAACGSLMYGHADGQQGIVQSCQPGNNDDWYWLWAVRGNDTAVSCMLVSSDLVPWNMLTTCTRMQWSSCQVLEPAGKPHMRCYCSDTSVHVDRVLTKFAACLHSVSPRSHGKDVGGAFSKCCCCNAPFMFNSVICTTDSADVFLLYALSRPYASAGAFWWSPTMRCGTTTSRC